MEKILKYRELVNIVPELSEDERGQIANEVLRDYEIDFGSNEKWRQKLEKGRKLFRQDGEKKNYPWPNASDVKYPLLTTAAIQFAARAYPAVVETPEPVKASVIGSDETGEKQDRAFRISKHMSWQLIHQMTEWEPGMDRGLHACPIDGCFFKKVYFDPIHGRNFSAFRTCDQVVVHSDTEDLESCPRVSEPIYYYPHEIIEKVRKGEFSSYEGYDEYTSHQEPVEFIEQHRRIDLDNDGYPEPYIATVNKENRTLVRLAANWDNDEIEKEHGKIIAIEPVQYYVKYSFIPDPEGGFYDIGFSQLLGPMNDSVNSILNQLIDAGHLANTGGGFIGRGMRIASGETRFSPGEWKKVDVAGGTIRDNVFALPVQQPSQVLFQLLGLLVDAAKEVSSVQDVLTGGGGVNMPATTVLAQIEQGMKVFTAIYKRLHRAMGHELKLLYRLNSKYLKDQEYFAIQDTQEAVARVDYEDKSLDIIPVSDPSMATDLQKMAKVQAMLGMGPLLDQNAVAAESLRLMNVDNPEVYLPKQQGPTPEQLEKMAELEIKKKEVDSKVLDSTASAIEKFSSALKNVADTDEVGVDNVTNTQELMVLVQSMVNLAGNIANGRNEGMDGQPGNAAMPPLSGSPQGGMEPAIGGMQGGMGAQPVHGFGPDGSASGTP